MEEDTLFHNRGMIKNTQIINIIMPFTVTHVVAVLPLYKYLGKFGALSALIIGSMIPDFAYMTPYLVHQRMHSHSLVGIYLYAIPMGLTIYFLYHFFMAPVLTSLLPKGIKQHLHTDLLLGKIPNIPSYILVFSLILGALTHIIWDFFTHRNGIPQYIDWFNIPLTQLDNYDIMPYRVLQHFSTLFGLSLLLFLIWRWLANKKNPSEPENQQSPSFHWQASKQLKTTAALIIIVVPIIGGAIYATLNVPTIDNVMFGLYKAQFFLRYGIVSAAGFFIICTVLLGMVYQYQIYKYNKE